jgi:hypothetical protein
VGGAIGTLTTPTLEAWVARCIEEFRQSGQQLAIGASDAAHLSEDEVVQRILEDASLQPLVMRVVDAAARTRSVGKLRALGAVLGEAVSNRPRRVDEDLLIVAALNDLEPAHLRVLVALEGSADPTHPERGWTFGAVEEAVPDLTAAGRQAALGGVISHGLVITTSLYSATGYELTEFGRAMLAVMRLSTAE